MRMYKVALKVKELSYYTRDPFWWHNIGMGSAYYVQQRIQSPLTFPFKQMHPVCGNHWFQCPWRGMSELMPIAKHFSAIILAVVQMIQLPCTCCEHCGFFLAFFDIDLIIGGYQYMLSRDNMTEFLLSHLQASPTLLQILTPMGPATIRTTSTRRFKNSVRCSLPTIYFCLCLTWPLCRNY